MKFIKYFLISLILLGGLSFGLFQITGVQDFLTKRAVQQQMQQQHIQNQQLQQQKQMAQMYSKMNGENKEDDPSLSMVDKIKAHFTKSIDVMIVFILTIIFNINTF